MYTNYCHTTLTRIFGKLDEYNNSVQEGKNRVIPTNTHFKSAVDKAHCEAKNKTEFKRLVKQYAKLTTSGIKECRYCQHLLSQY